MTEAVFRSQMQRLAGLRFVPATFETHWEALQDLTDSALESAVTRAQKTRVEFPTPFELRQDADQVVRVSMVYEDRSVPRDEPIDLGTLPTGYRLPVSDRIWRYYCEECRDTGTQMVWCGKRQSGDMGPRQPWMPIEECETYNCKHIKNGSPDYGHEWHRPCPCQATNPALVRKREAAMKYAEKPAK